MDDNMLNILSGIIILVISYFLKGTMNDLKETKAMGITTKNELDILRNDHVNKYEHLTEGFTELKQAIKDLTLEIRDLTKELNSEKKSYKG